VSPASWTKRHPCLALRLAALALIAAGLYGCGNSFRAARLTRPVSMSPLADATVSVEAGRVFVTEDVVGSGLGDGSALAVELGITNAGREPYQLSAASISCWMELSPDLPGETLSLTPAGGGEGSFPEDLAPDDMKLGSTTIPPGQTRRYWVVFRGYRYPGSEVPRRITVLLPDPRGRRVEVVIADPARGQLRWEVNAAASGLTYGLQNISLLAPGLTAMAMSGQVARVARAGPILWDVGITARTLVQLEGRLVSKTSSFSGIGATAHVTWPLAKWGAWQDPRWFGLYAGGEAQVLTALEPPPEAGEPMRQPKIYGVLAAEGGVEFDIGALHPAATPFPISFTGPALPRWSFRVGYTHWFVDGLNSGGYSTLLRLAW
jgi:hypothetical protein